MRLLYDALTTWAALDQRGGVGQRDVEDKD